MAITLKDYFGKYSPLVVALVGLASAGVAGKITDLYKQYEHLSLIHASAVFLIVVLMYLLSQVGQLPAFSKHVEEHSKELHELAAGYAKIVSSTEKLLEVLNRMESSLDKNESKQSDIDVRLARLEGYKNGKESKR